MENEPGVLGPKTRIALVVDLLPGETVPGPLPNEQSREDTNGARICRLARASQVETMNADIG